MAKHIQTLLDRVADIIDVDGWDRRYEWQKSSADGKSIQEACRLICDERFQDFELCLREVRLRIHPHGMKSLADFEDAPGRTKEEVCALLRGHSAEGRTP